MRLFSQEASVINAGVVFIRVNFLFITANILDNVLMGTLRGYGDSQGPMIIMITTHVFFRQLYLFVVTRYVMNIPAAVGFAYPAGWLSCFMLLLAYYFYRRSRGFISE
jgi:Na+-driven multidrug efflux pump